MMFLLSVKHIEVLDGVNCAI